MKPRVDLSDVTGSSLKLARAVPLKFNSALLCQLCLRSSARENQSNLRANHLKSVRMRCRARSKQTASLSVLETRCCQGCGESILDKFLLLVNGRSWHGDCLRCCICHTSLDEQTSCFIRDNRIYCKGDYVRSFGAKCSKCSRGISASDWVRKARDHVYHLACFACDACKRQLSTGEEFALHEDRVLCKTHYLEILDGGSTSSDGERNIRYPPAHIRSIDTADSESHSGSSGNRSKTKRVRTTFTDEQLQVLQANFQLDSNPDGQDLERIAQITGLSKRVTQVWFQNSRARQKKHSTIVAQQTDSNIHIHPHHPHHRLLAHQLHHSGVHNKKEVFGKLFDSCSNALINERLKFTASCGKSHRNEHYFRNLTRILDTRYRTQSRNKRSSLDHRSRLEVFYVTVFPMSEVHLPPETLSQSPDVDSSSFTMLYSVG
uniref:Arrowhead n=1 Tax=Timema tahoe TaxID=61484 RepID=A0A7R9FN03_9NEOP|nr:unnamed protein product [Timema tahoe]